MYFGKNLRYLRKLKNWSQEQIADKLGVSLDMFFEIKH